MQSKQTLASVAAALLLGSIAHGADNYKIDPAHTRVGFSARHFGINSVKGQFKEFTGTLVLNGDALKEATATIQVVIGCGCSAAQLTSTLGGHL